MKRLTLAVLALCASSFAADNLALWTKYKPITINTKATGANVAGNVARIPVLVRLDSVNAADVFAQASAGGADVRFANAAGVPKPYQIEYWSTAAKKAAIWVLPDTVKGNDSAVSLRLYWGNPSATSASNGSAVFDTANGYVSVWHLGDSSGANPRPNQIPGAPTAILKNFGQPTTEDPTPAAYGPKAGIIGFADSLRGGGGDELTGTKDFIDLNRRGYQGFSDFNAGFEFSAWIYSTGPVFAERFIEILDDTTLSASSDTRIILFGNRTDPVPNGVSVRWGAGGTYNSPNENLYTGNEWYHFVFTKPAGNGPMRIFRNGVQTDSTNNLPDLAVGLRNFVYMGRSSVTASDPYYQGKFDEVRISRRQRSADWAKLSFETQKATASAVILGTTQTQTVTPVALSGFAYTAKAADTLILGTGRAFALAPAFNGGPVDSFKVVSGTLPAGLAVAKANGVLSGTPTAAAAASDIVIRAWGHAAAGDSVSRTVRITVFVPAALNYTPDSLTYNINQAISTLSPAYTGSTPTYSVSPALPAGLSLNTSTGAITGTPTAVTARASYTVKAKTSVDSSLKVLRIAVIDPTSVDGRAGFAASGFSAKSLAQGILFRVGGTAPGEKVILNLVDMFGRTVYGASFSGESLNWNGLGDNGQSVSPGIYVARVRILDAQGRIRRAGEHKVPLMQ
jgi:hypothetical protein